jgi:ferredoxin-thioredoxin reductase catalytic subunit
VMDQPRCRVCGEYLPLGESVVTCINCGTKSRIIHSENECIAVSAVSDREAELRERVEEFARLRSYGFSDFKERVIQALLKKQEVYGDFYCPCKARTVLENVCPCKETREGDVELNGKCSCRLFWKR